jgi:hypothetical protein
MLRQILLNPHFLPVLVAFVCGYFIGNGLESESSSDDSH